MTSLTSFAQVSSDDLAAARAEMLFRFEPMQPAPLVATATTGAVREQQTSQSLLVFNHVALSVKDLDVAADFYGRVLNLHELSKESRAKGVRWFSLGEGKELHLISHEYYKGDNVVINKAVHLALASSNFDEVLKLLDSHKVRYGNWTGTLRQIDTRSDGVKQIFLQDPDGYWIEINNAGKNSDDLAKARAEILPLFESMQVSANEHDAERYMSFYAREPSLLFVINDEAIIGYDALLVKQRQWWQNGKTDVEYKLVGEPDFRMSAPGLVMVTYFLTSRRTMQDGTPRNTSFGISALWQNRPEGWRIIHAHESTVNK
jgi:catechol 2,3-dioxygenase-like lactoylglutathione lyase family enzyme/ketosteroid isomerase-like protein